MGKIITCPNCNTIFDMREGVPVPTPQPTPVPIPLPQPTSVANGSKTSPFKMNKPTSAVYGGYIAENENINAEIGISAGAKVYYEVDPNGLPFKLFVGFFSGAGTICKCTQNKITGQFSSEECRGSDSYMDIVNPPLADTKYLYAIDNSGSPGPALNKLWVVMPFNP